jgi:Fe-S cluster assembly ATP-binding protein
MITHNTRILDKLSVDRTHVMVHGNLVEEGPADLITEIDTHGFGRFEQALENSEKSQEA